MDSIRMYLRWVASAALLVTIFLSVACQKPANSATSVAEVKAITPPPSSAAQSNGGGGLDGSGGDTIQSSEAEVHAALTEELGNLPERLNNMGGALRLQPEITEFLYGKESRSLLQDFFKDGSASLSDGTVITSESFMISNIKNHKIKMTVQASACSTADGIHAGSAIGDVNAGEICISTDKLRLLPPKILNEEIFKLLIHEISHLAGFNESKAVSIQTLISIHPQIYTGLGYSKSRYFISGLQSCGSEKLDAEVAEMNASPYWKAQEAKLLQMLSGSLPRGCGSIDNRNADKLDIFSDDAEFLFVTAKFAQSDLRWYARDKSEPGIQPSWSWIQDVFMVSSLSIRTSTASMNGLVGKIGTDAQCSPKVLLANVIANTEDIFHMGCGNNNAEFNSVDHIKTRIAKEKEILANAPKLGENK